MIIKKNQSQAISKIIGVSLLSSLFFLQSAFADRHNHSKNTIKNSPTVWEKNKTPDPKYPDYRHILGFHRGRLRGNAVLSVAAGLGTVQSSPATNMMFHLNGAPGTPVSATTYGGQSVGFSMYAGLGYELNIAGKGSTGFYLAGEFMYGLFASSNPALTGDTGASGTTIPTKLDVTTSGTPLMNMFGFRIRIGASFQDRMSKLYAIVGFTGTFVDSYNSPIGDANKLQLTQDSTHGFAPIFGIGYARTLMREILDIFFEFEGTPFVDTSASMASGDTTPGGSFFTGDMQYNYMLNFRAGLRLMF